MRARCRDSGVASRRAAAQRAHTAPTRARPPPPPHPWGGAPAPRAHIEQALAPPLARELVGGPAGCRLLLEQLDLRCELRGNALELEAIEHRRERAGCTDPLRLEARQQPAH